MRMRLAAYRTGSGAAPIGYQLLDQLGARGLVLDQHHAGGGQVALLAHRALERRVFEPLE